MHKISHKFTKTFVNMQKSAQIGVNPCQKLKNILLFRAYAKNKPNLPAFGRKS